MKLQCPHATAAITALCLAGAVGANIFTLNWRDHFIAYAGASLLLASPFAVLLAGHLTLAKTWRRNTFLAIGSVLLALAWWLASFLMRWLQPSAWVGRGNLLRPCAFRFGGAIYSAFPCRSGGRVTLLSNWSIDADAQVRPCAARTPFLCAGHFQR
jgi:hypothetical protein